MSKPLIWVLIIIGISFLVLGIFNKTFLLLGLGAIAAALYVGLGPDGILRKEQVHDTWAALIEGANGKGEETLKDTENFINTSKAPDISIEQREISPGLVTGMIGKRKTFLIIADRSFRLAPYKIYMNARDYGELLDVSWYLTYKPSFWQSMVFLLPFVNTARASFEELDLFDQQDLRAFVTNTHQCVLKAVDKLMLSLNQDPNKLDRKSRGFFGIS